MKTKHIRQEFLSYFEKKGHKIVPSAPMVVKDDPTLMFTNAGMNQFKEFFLGNAVAQHKRVTDSQKCLRVSGKHNDLDEVGVDTYHHTMFEMLGNWSFGDYFKEEAIEWSWELLTEVFKVNKDNLYVTIFEGDEKDGVPRDEEAFNFWKKWIPENRIIEADKKDNFWEMGEMGPCGPCSEIHVDIRSQKEKEKIDGKTLVNQDHPQVIEIWNLVFIQFNRKADGSLEKLPETHVDTGMGLERLAMVLQGKQSNYDIDLFQNLIEHIEEQSGFQYGKNETTDIALRVIADHVRAIAFSIADGQLPSNTGEGYVIRRILRRAVRYGYQNLQLNNPFLAPLSRVLVELMGDAFPELAENSELIEKVIEEEERSFFRTLEQGIKRIDGIITQQKQNKEKEISGEQAFELYDTFGFPFDLTSLMAREAQLSVDEKGFNQALQVQKDRSRSATSVKTADWTVLIKSENETFIGYDKLSAEIKITRYRKVEQKKKSFYQLVFDKTPFYPEGGGQIGDQGYIASNGEKIAIFDTKKENNLIVHLTKELPKDLKSTFEAVVNKERRDLTASNHSATHLLHYALQKVLGDHVTQKGSLVHPDYLRFDFSHFSKVTDEEIIEIEEIVNGLIFQNIPLNEMRNIPIQEAKDKGAMMLFGEKYGDHVRVIQFGDSTELCGGTHVTNTGNIGRFKIVSEGSVASGIRRIEAITNKTAEKYIQNKLAHLEQIESLFKNPKDIVQSVTVLIEKNHALQKHLQQLEKEQIKTLKSDLKNKIQNKNGINYLEAIVPFDGKAIKDILFQLKGEQDTFFAVIGGKNNGKCTLSIVVSEDLVKAKKLHAGNIIREVAHLIQGGGGGQPFFATAGGKNPDGLSAAIDAVKAML